MVDSSQPVLDRVLNMADFGSPVADKIDTSPTRGLKTIADLMGLQQQQQSIQSSGLTIQRQGQQVQTGDIEVQKAQQANIERLNLQAFTQDPNNWQTDGKIDMSKINSAVPKIAPYTGEEYIGKLSTLSAAQTEALSAKQNLTQAQRAIIAGPIGVLGRAGVTDPAAYVKELENLKATNPDNPDIGKLVDSYKTVLGLTQPGPHVAQTAITASQSLMGPAEQQQNLSPTATTVGLGGQVSPAIVTPAVGGNAPSVQIGNLAPNQAANVTVSPSERQSVGADVLGRPITVGKDQTGNLSVGAPPGANYKPVMAFPPGENTSTIPEVLKIRTDANNLAAQAPAQHFANDQILKLSPEAFTGTGGGQLAKVLGAVGIQSTNSVSADTAQLKHFVSLQIEQNAAAQGANTDAARSLAASAVLPTDSPEQAIKNITKVNDGYVTGNELYSQGMNAAINNPNNQKDVFAARDFRNAWAKAFDPRIAMLENAQKAGDRETIERILGKPNTPTRVALTKELKAKALTLQRLAQGVL